jgi:hypothetical protein
LGFVTTAHCRELRKTERFNGEKKTLMASRKLFSLFVDVFENGARMEVGDLTEDERDAICAEIEELWMDHYRFEAHRREFIAALSHEDEDIIYLLARENGRPSAFPPDWDIREVTIGAPKVNEQTLKLVGDRIPLRLPGYPGRRLEVQFSDV